MPVSAWSTTAALNVESTGISGTGGGVGIQGTNLPSNFDNALRDIMAQIATFVTGATYTGTTALTMNWADNGATVGPTFTLLRTSTTPAVSDIIGRVLYQGKDSAANTEDYAEIDTQIDDPTSTSEDATVRVRAKVAGTMTTIATFSAAGLQLPTAAAPASTVDGMAKWDSDDNVLVVGDGATQIILGDAKISAEQASTSGTSIDFTGIPTWAKRITIMFKGVSTNGTSDIVLQLGDAGGVENSGYLGAASNLGNGSLAAANFTASFGIGYNHGSAATIMHGTATLTLEDASDFSWTCASSMASSNTVATYHCAGSKSTSQALDRVRVTTAGGTDTFDAGVISIQYSA